MNDQPISLNPAASAASQSPLISVVTPSYNQARFIEQTIQSVLAQNYPNFEHIIMDGASTDGTVAVLKRYPHLQWVSEKDQGQSSALNKCFKLARGEIIAWVNSDDFYEPNIFPVIAKFFVDHPEKNIVMGDCNLVDMEGKPFKRVINAERSFQQLKKYWRSESIPTQPAIFFRRKLLAEFGPVDETLHYGMDYDLWLRFAQKHHFHHLDLVAANYRFHQDAKGGTSDWTKFKVDWRIVYARYANGFCLDHFIAKLKGKT